MKIVTGQGRSVHCTDECRALGHSDRCWMPKLRVGSQADSADNRTNLFIPVGMEAMVETEIYGSLKCSAARKTLSTFGKEQRDSIILVANVKPYLKSQHGLSPLLQECSSASSSPTKGDTPLDSPTKGPREEVGRVGEGGSDSSAYGPPDGQCSPPHTELEEPSYLSCDLSPKSLSNSLIHSSGIRSGIISQECGGMECVNLDQRDSGN